MSGYCKGRGRISDCACGEVELTMTDNYLSENYVNKRVLRKLVDEMRAIGDGKGEWTDPYRSASDDWADRIEKVLNKGGE